MIICRELGDLGGEIWREKSGGLGNFESLAGKLGGGIVRVPGRTGLVSVSGGFGFGFGGKTGSGNGVESD